jgi:hypothetical protein
MPVFLCRGFGKLPIQVKFFNHEIFKWFKRKHGVLLEINLLEKVIRMHDSQDAMLHYFYPDKIEEMIDEINHLFGFSLQYNSNQHYHAYDIQDDDFSCGYYVLAYLEHILSMGSSRECHQVGLNDKGEKIGLRMKECYQNKYQFAQEKYGVTFYQMNIVDNNDQSKTLLEEINLDDEWFDIDTTKSSIREFEHAVQSLAHEFESEALTSDWLDTQTNKLVPVLDETSLLVADKSKSLLCGFNLFHHETKVQLQSQIQSCQNTCKNNV